MGDQVELRLECDPVAALDTDALVLPGVGAFSNAATRLASGADRMRDAILGGLPTLCICLGMQLLFDASEEGDVACLGLLPGTVRRMHGSAALRVPHMGWNTLEKVRESELLDAIAMPAHAYFVHGYAAPVTADCIASCTHGEAFAACVQRGHIAGMQFHPERSADVGSRLLANILRWDPEMKILA